jgi:hypothetical protein
MVKSKAGDLQMTDGRSREDLMDFLGYLGEKGLMNQQTAAARKASVSSFLSVLSAEEAKDITALDLNQVTTQFINLKGRTMQQGSIKVYKSRVESSIRDFIAYKRDPLTFKPNIGQRERKPTEGRTAVDPAVTNSFTPKMPNTGPEHQTDTVIFPIPLRQGLIIRIAGIPPDLTSAEARKIGNVLMALASDTEN